MVFVYDLPGPKNIYSPEALSPGQTCCWWFDTVKAGGTIVKGEVRHFTVISTG